MSPINWLSERFFGRGTRTGPPKTKPMATPGANGAGLWTQRTALTLKKQEDIARDPSVARRYLSDGNGYVREAALDALITNAHLPVSLTELAERLNDWVGPVRSKALVLARDRLPTLPRAQFVALIPTEAKSMLSWSRAGDRAVFELFFIETPQGRAATLDWLSTAKQGPASVLLNALLRREGVDDQLERLALDAPHPATRAIAMRALLRGVAVVPVGTERVWVDKSLGHSRRQTKTETRPLAIERNLPVLLDAAARDRSAKVRRLAADYLIEHGYEALPADAVARLEDDDAVAERMDFARRKWRDGGATTVPVA